MTSRNGFWRFATDTSPEGIRESILSHLRLSLARSPDTATTFDWWISTAMMCQDHIVDRFLATYRAQKAEKVKRLYFFSLEYFLGRLLHQNLISLGILEQTKKALIGLGLDIDQIFEEEPQIGLGNGGLGRLAACFLDSLSTLRYPAFGYGLHYEFGLFHQDIINGYQVERPDDWTRFGVPWEIIRPRYSQVIRLYGNIDWNKQKPVWVGGKEILGVPYDYLIPGYNSPVVNVLRLWRSKSTVEFDLEAFNRGGYFEAVAEKNFSESISKVLYPNDKTEIGRELRLIQQYFFVSCSLHDIIRRFLKEHSNLDDFPSKVVIHLNDTHPAIAIAELMRIFLDEHNLSWSKSWELVSQCFAYTNHTLMPEALEKWSVPLFERVLPRHLQIIYEINKQLLDNIPLNIQERDKLIRQVSLIEETQPKLVRMANLAICGSYSINGVSALHSELLKKELFHPFYILYPKKFHNVTNGITPRLWLLASNPRLSNLITEVIGDGWPSDLEQLDALKPYAQDPAFKEKYNLVKQCNKDELSNLLKKKYNFVLDPEAIFDVQIKRIHEYKRQHLNLLHILSLYRRLLDNPNLDIHPRVFLIAGKAAPGYDLAKCIIKAINAVGYKINNDPRVNKKLRVYFVPNYGVWSASKIIPAADVSEQISTAGKEASGTGNMKLALNGALTVGTMDGANIEILEAVGERNIFIFGLRAEEIRKLSTSGYSSRKIYESDPEIKYLLDWLKSGEFSQNEPPSVLYPVVHSLIDGGDPFFVLADFHAYKQTQLEVDQQYKDRQMWISKAILNTASLGWFSSDRSIQQYATNIWDLSPCLPK
ncbi:glycogen/starch/alpha-glucan phosphorylase [Methylacidiphilum caldifontis]|uniref:Alpha-1,4 glucan phosphorylase n=1 Tax=Methylacidiphilum caldifontis TaxID=2795386 RepID=A0A4Y8PCP8_9BACT|nr:glycogen/starch/alpha-glucan phosphorylase [Methylacidiphilum caldifontis]TFE68768.1 glycogen phosphorylase [Methylacidiphilum caldifontis]